MKEAKDRITRVCGKDLHLTAEQGYTFFEHNNGIRAYRDSNFILIPWHRIICVEGEVVTV